MFRRRMMEGVGGLGSRGRVSYLFIAASSDDLWSIEVPSRSRCIFAQK